MLQENQSKITLNGFYSDLQDIHCQKYLKKYCLKCNNHTKFNSYLGLFDLILRICAKFFVFKGRKIL